MTRAALILLLAVLTAAGGRELRGIEALTRVYDAILDADYDRVEAELQRACPPAPREACEVLDATALWWRIQLDPESRAFDPAFTKSVERAIVSTEAWVARAPAEAEAWFYLGGAYAARVQWSVLRDEKMGAARDGKRILQALERALTLDPSLDDAYFARGMYKYYADAAPRAAKFLRVLLMLPGGNRKEGLAEMLRARARGQLVRGEADYQLHVIYLWYEKQTPRAIELLEGLRKTYPHNPLFPAEIARIQDEYLHDITESLDIWRELLDAATSGRVNASALAEARARLAIARLLDRLHETDAAIVHLNAVVALKAQAPHGALSLAHLRLGEALDRMGERTAAVEAYKRALATTPYPDRNIRSTADARIRRAPDATRAEAYRLSVHGWRQFEQNDAAEAESALRRSLALHAGDPVAHYRLGRVLVTNKDDVAARQAFETAIAGARTCPPPILGAAYLESARLHERAGLREQARARYRVAATLFGAAAETRTSAARALTRLGASESRPPRRDYR